MAARVAGVGPGRLRVADRRPDLRGQDQLRARARRPRCASSAGPRIRASLDDFKNPWREARELGYDRVSGEGYYRNAYDFRSARDLLLAPAAPGGSGDLVLCAHDPLTGEDHRDKTIAAPADAVLIVDSVFAFRPEYNGFWDYRIWLEVDAGLALRRGIARDAAREGAQEASRVHRDRYYAAEMIYLAEVGPRSLADLIIDNSDFTRPVILGGRTRRARSRRTPR